MTDESNTLGAFLRARRELVTPLQAGISGGGARRVPGLRREEVAMLAGISADYYLRLERGRDRHPSVQVLEAIGRVLQLDDEHLSYMLSLVADAPRRRRRRPRKETVPVEALTLLDALVQPAYIEGRYFDILASNRLARALSPGLAVGGNQLRDLFLDPAEQARYPDWEAITECFIASLRLSVGTDIDDPRFIELTGELSLGSERFRQLWARHEVRGQTATVMRVDHPQLGELTLNRSRLAISGTDGLVLMILHPDPGTADEEKLELLASVDLPAHDSALDLARAQARPQAPASSAGADA